LVDFNSRVITVKQVFTPWCFNCEDISKQVEKLAKHYKGSRNLIFARIDASANEHPKFQVSVVKKLVVSAFIYSTINKTLNNIDH
jgi:thioredoxin-like negative regulator of GroEL